MTKPVTPQRIKVATQHGLANAEVAAEVCREVGLPFFVVCALLEQESMGRNVYGHDAGGAMSGFPDPVNFGNWRVFRWLVIDKGQTSNGVGPCQLTYKGFFLDMEKQGLKPWRVRDNMFYGFRLLKGYHDKNGNWILSGQAYNGSRAYGEDLNVKIKEWKRRLAI